MRAVFVALMLLAASPTWAQCEDKQKPRVVVQGDFYAHNTEFFDNPYREGETLLGNNLKAFGAFPLGCKAEIRIGAFADIRAGDENQFRTVRPVASLVIESSLNSFIMGTLISRNTIPSAGPDRDGLHGLLPPIQNDEFSIERPYETGLQWFHTSTRFLSEFWVNWQMLNTSEHREKFDVGFVERFTLSGPLSIGGQLHVVHHGGQLFDAGQPVADSLAAAAGLILERDRPKLLLVAGPRVFDQINNELYFVNSRHTPDRSDDTTKLNGRGIFYRSTIRWNSWRIHIIRWWAKDFVKDEGDPNYGFRHLDGSYSPLVGSTRSYIEYGIFREYRLDESLTLEGGLKLHKVGNERTDYSYEIRGVFDLSFPFRS